MTAEHLRRGTRLRHRDGTVVTLTRRKTEDETRRRSGTKRFKFVFSPGWWLKEGGGLADWVIDDPERGDWEVIT